MACLGQQRCPFDSALADGVPALWRPTPGNRLAREIDDRVRSALRESGAVHPLPRRIPRDGVSGRPTAQCNDAMAVSREGAGEPGSDEPRRPAEQNGRHDGKMTASLAPWRL